MRASLILPPSWDYASALPVASRTGQHINFKTVTLETLVDSPTDSGRYTGTSRCGAARVRGHYLDAFADHPEDLSLQR